MRRIGRLSQGAVQLLRLASIYPDRFDVARLRVLADASDDRLIDHIDEALGVGVIVARDGSYVFAHALLRRALYEAMNPDRRCRLHRRAAEQLARAEEPPGEIALHYNASRQIPGARAGVAFALRAAERAADAHLNEQRAVFLRIAADLQSASVTEELLRDLARCCAQADALDIDAAERTAHRVLEIVRGARPETGEPARLLDFLISLARRLRDAGASPAVWLQFVDVGLEACARPREPELSSFSLLCASLARASALGRARPRGDAPSPRPGRARDSSAAGRRGRHQRDARPVRAPNEGADRGAARPGESLALRCRDRPGARRRGA